MKHENTFDIPKREISLPDFAAQFGYRIDRKKSTRASIAMKSDQDKIIISKKKGVWVYFSVTDERDSGTIVDFVVNRTSKSMAEIANELLGWNGSISVKTTSDTEVTEKSHDTARVQAIFGKCKTLTNFQYLESRGLTAEVLTSQRFAGRLFEDRHGNVAFPHFRNREVCGLELKNSDRGMLVMGSQKTFWRSNTMSSDETLVITESVIDALSYHQLHSHEDAIYLATGGGVSVSQCQLLSEMIEATPQLNAILLATDNDDGGNRIAERLTEAIKSTEFSGDLLQHRPYHSGEDWNEALNRHKKGLSHSWQKSVMPHSQLAQLTHG